MKKIFPLFLLLALLSCVPALAEEAPDLTGQCKITVSSQSKRAAKMELRRKGIDDETAQAALDGIDVDYQQQITAIIERKYPHIEDEKTRRRAVAALQRLGYGWDDIKAALSCFEE